MIIKPLQSVISEKSVFLAGTIDNGESEDWQSRVEKVFDRAGWIVYNPRRDDWDSSWKQSIEDEQFNRQVNWELDALDRASTILMYLAGNSKSPISLLELGLHARSNKLIVCCEKDFYRRGNVEIVCDRYDIPLFPTLDPVVNFLIKLHE